MMNKLESFQQLHSYLFAIAYRMLGTVSDAEDVLQDAYLRWEQVVDEEVESPRAYLASVVSRLCIDRLRSAKSKREEYIGPWLPEPLTTAEDPERLAEKADSLSMAFLVLLESLSPLERAAFLLHEVFEYDYSQIARITGKNEANCRQLVHRAKDQIAARRPRFESTKEEQEQLLQKFVDACSTGDLQGLLSLLSNDIELYSDGGGKTYAALNPIYGQDHVARFLLGVLKKVPANFRAELTRMNNEPAIIGYHGDQLTSVLLLHVEAGAITRIFTVVNPEKLRHLTRS